MLSVIMQSVIMLCYIMQSVIMLYVIMLSGIMLKVMATARDDLIYNKFNHKETLRWNYCLLYFLVGEAHSSQWQ
jgi:hypothetical protein